MSIYHNMDKPEKKPSIKILKDFFLFSVKNFNKILMNNNNKKLRKKNTGSPYPVKARSINMKGVKHYKRDGTVHKGSMHKMKDGTLHSNKSHTKTSVKLFNQVDNILIRCFEFFTNTIH